MFDMSLIYLSQHRGVKGDLVSLMTNICGVVNGRQTGKINIVYIIYPFIL